MKLKNSYVVPEAHLLTPILKSSIMQASVILPDSQWVEEVEL